MNQYEPENPERPSRRRGWARLRLGFVATIAGVFLFLLIYLAPSIFITIRSGQVGVRYLRFFGGTQVDRVLGEGLTTIAPWDKLFIYSIRVQEAKHTIEVLTKEGLSVKLYLSIRYHPEPEMVGMLHQRIGPNYKELIVIPEVESSIRMLMGQFTMAEVSGSGRGLLQKVINESLEHVSQQFVTVDEIVLRRVELSPKITQAIEDKMAQKVSAEAYEYKLQGEKLEAERKEIEANGTKRANDILNSSLTPIVLRWKGLEVTGDLAKSPNSKIIFVGPKASDLPVLLGADK